MNSLIGCDAGEGPNVDSWRKARSAPLNRQAERYAREGVDLSLSTLADQVGAVAELLKPLNALIEAHVFAAARLHGDDTTVPLLARGGTKTARLWTYVRDDRHLGGTAPPAVVFRFSRDRGGEHPTEHLKDAVVGRGSNH